MSKVGNATNNYNNQIAINLFLNNECKNAMNLTDFMNFRLSVDDLDYTKANGYVKGITNIFVKNLRDLNLENDQFTVVIKSFTILCKR